MPHHPRGVSFEHVSVDFFSAVVILDIDGTILPDNEYVCSEEVKKKILEIRQNNILYLSTNSRNTKRNHTIANSLGLVFAHTSARKPFGVMGEDTRKKEQSLVVIGDKWMTDFLFSKKNGGTFIRVRRKWSGQERFHIRISYWLDDLLWRIANYF